MDNLEYAEMLEIPVNTVNVVKKRGFFRRRDKKEDLKDDVIADVNSRAYDESAMRTDFIQTEDLSEAPVPRVKRFFGENGVLVAEAVAACLLAGGIFLTNALVDNTAINNIAAGLANPVAEETPYTEFELSSVISPLSDAEVVQSAGGVLSFTAETSVYPVCDGKITSVTSADGLYTVEIAHTSTFASVFTGLSDVYVAVGDEVKSNIPFARSGGENAVSMTMFNDGEVISGYTLSGAVPVWNS